MSKYETVVSLKNYGKYNEYSEAKYYLSDMKVTEATSVVDKGY